MYAGFNEKAIKDYAQVIEIYGDGEFRASASPSIMGGEKTNYADISLGFVDLNGVNIMTIKIANTTNYLTVFKDDSPPNSAFLETYLIGEQSVAPQQESSTGPYGSGIVPTDGAVERVYLDNFEAFAVSGLNFTSFGDMNGNNSDGSSIYEDYIKTNTGKTFEHGVSFHGSAGSRSYALEGQYQIFTGTFALTYRDKDDNTSASVEIYGDDVLLKSSYAGKGELPVEFRIDVTNVQIMRIKINSGYNDRYYNYLLGDAYFE
jgi:hypothetical protein